MYKIKTSDEKQHGPYMINVVEQWIAAGKTDEGTLFQKVGESEWKPLSEIPELGGSLPVAEPQGPRQAPRRSQRKTSSRTNQPRTSSMAVASLILGVLGVTALFGLILGIIAQIKISRGTESIKGAGYAISGMVVSGIMLLFGVPIVIGVVVPDWVRSQEKANAAQCVERAGYLAESLKLYAAENEGTYPQASSWCDDLLKSASFGYSRIAFVCPSEPQVRSGFAMNTNLVDLVVSNMHPRTVLFFESKMGWNGHGGFPQLANYRHRGSVTIGFVDGTVQPIPVWQVSQLRWIP